MNRTGAATDGKATPAPGITPPPGGDTALPDLSDPRIRRRALRRIDWQDHGILRYLWTNLHEVAPGVFRSNQPHDARLAQHARQGIRTIINLRGETTEPRHLLQVESCRRLGLHLVSVPLRAGRAPDRALLASLIATFRAAERPLVMHCKSGADRTGFASAVWLMVMEGRPVEDARRMLSLRFVHIRKSRKGILGHILQAYADAHAQDGIGFEDWVATGYDRAAIQARFDSLPWWRR